MVILTKYFYHLSLSIVFLFFIITLGCSVDPAKKSEFLKDSPEMEKYSRYPYQRVWLRYDAEKNKNMVKSLIIAPVNITYIEKMDWFKLQDNENQQIILAEALELGDYFQSQLKDKIATETHLKITDNPGLYTSRVEIAIVELIPSDVWWNAAATGAGFVVPGAGMLKTFGAGSIAIEMKITDSNTGDLIGLLADREVDKSAPIDVAALSWFQGSKNNIDDWVDIMVDSVNTGWNEQVTDKAQFRLSPW